MDIIQDWQKIKIHFRSSFKSSLHVSIASLLDDETPTVTPIGSLFLNDDQTGFYFEKYPSALPRQASQRPSICVLGVNSSSLFWVRSLFKGKFDDYPAIKLYGTLGIKRKATPAETNRLMRRMRFTRFLKGHTYLWKNMEFIREIHFTHAEKIKLGNMTSDLS